MIVRRHISIVYGKFSKSPFVESFALLFFESSLPVKSLCIKFTCQIICKINAFYRAVSLFKKVDGQWYVDVETVNSDTAQDNSVFDHRRVDN